VILLPLAWLGCETGSADPCARYADEEVRAYCVVAHGRTARTYADARCESAGPWAEECRQQWVMSHTELPLPELLAVCPPGDADCRMLVLDWRPEPLLTQLPLCEQLPGTYAPACVTHALVRYWGASPTPEDQRATIPGVGRWQASALQVARDASGCGVAVDCAAFGAAEATCRAELRPPGSHEECDGFHDRYPRPR